MYDTKAGGFITSVTTEPQDTDQDNSDANEEDDEEKEDPELEKGNAEKLILTQDTYNTLNRTGKKKVSFDNSQETEKMKDFVQSCESV